MISIGEMCKYFSASFKQSVNLELLQQRIKDLIFKTLINFFENGHA